MAADPVAVQDGDSRHLPAAHNPGRFRNDQERLRGPHRHRTRAQRKGGGVRPDERYGSRGGRLVNFNELLGLMMLIALIGVIFIGFPISFTLLFLALSFGYV